MAKQQKTSERARAEYEVIPLTSGQLQDLVFAKEFPRKVSASPYRKALLDLRGKAGCAARFRDTPAARTALRSGAEALGMRVNFAVDGEYVYVQLASKDGTPASASESRQPGLKSGPGGGESLPALILEAIRRKPMSSIELAAALRIEVQKVYQPLSNLKTRGLIESRTDDAGDGTRRYFLVGAK